MYFAKEQNNENKNTNRASGIEVLLIIAQMVAMFLHLFNVSPLLSDIILLVMNVALSVFTIFMPIINKNIYVSDYAIIQPTFCIFMCYIIFLSQAEIETLPSQNWEQIRLLLYFQIYNFLILYIVALSSIFILKSLLKVKNSMMLRWDMPEIISKIVTIISIIVNYIVIVHDEYSPKIINIYCFLAEAIIIPIIFSLLQNKKRNDRVLRTK